VKQGLTKILARLSQCGFEVVAIKKTQIQSDMVDELGACKVPERGAQNFTPMIREMWARDLLENECVVMVVKRINAVYQLHVLAGLEAPNEDGNNYGGSGYGNSYGNSYGSSVYGNNYGNSNYMSYGNNYLSNDFTTNYPRRGHSSIGTSENENTYWLHNLSTVKNGPTLKNLAGQSLIQNAIWVPSSYDEAVEEIKKFFPHGLPCQPSDNQILFSENIPTPAFDREVNVNIRQIHHVHKGIRLYPELPKMNKINNGLSSFGTTSFSTINTTDIAIIILDAEMFKVQELIDRRSDEEESEEEEKVEENVAVESTVESPLESETGKTDLKIDEGDLAENETSSDSDNQNSKHSSKLNKNRHRYFQTETSSSSFNSSSSEEDDDFVQTHNNVILSPPDSETILSNDSNEDSDVDVEKEENQVTDLVSQAQALKTALNTKTKDILKSSGKSGKSSSQSGSKSSSKSGSNSDERAVKIALKISEIEKKSATEKLSEKTASLNKKN